MLEQGSYSDKAGFGQREAKKRIKIETCHFCKKPFNIYELDNSRYWPVGKNRKYEPICAACVEDKL